MSYADPGGRFTVYNIQPFVSEQPKPASLSQCSVCKRRPPLSAFARLAAACARAPRAPVCRARVLHRRGARFVLFVAIQSYLPAHHHASAALAGYVLAAYGAAKLAGQFGAGWLIDRMAPRRGLLDRARADAAPARRRWYLGGAHEPNAVPAAALLYGLGGAVVWPSLFAIGRRRVRGGRAGAADAGMTMVDRAGAGDGAAALAWRCRRAFRTPPPSPSA